MPPKPQNNPSGKGQTSLFSFFQKPAAAAAPAAPAASESPAEEKTEVN